MKPYLIIGLLVAWLASYGLVWHLANDAGYTKADDKAKAEKIVQEEAHGKDIEKMRTTENNLRAAMTQNEKDKRNANQKLVADYAVIIDSLLHRADRPAETGQATAVAGASEGCTGAQLYGPDARFLAGEAARAERVRINLAQCQADYDDARRTLMEAAQ